MSDADAPRTTSDPDDPASGRDATARPARPARARIRRATLWAGPVGVAVSLSGVLGSAALAPWFTWTGHALSELGRVGEPTAPLFNTALVLGGLLGVAFAGRVWVAAANAAHRAGVALLAVAFASMSLVGVFPLPQDPHGPVAVTFFVAFTYGLFAHGSGDVLAGRPRLGLPSIWLGVAHVTGWLLLVPAPWSGIALPELVGSLALSAWVLWTFADLRA